MARNPRVDTVDEAGPSGVAPNSPGGPGPPSLAGQTPHAASGDAQWDRVLAHRQSARSTDHTGGNGTSRGEAAHRFIASGVSPDQVAAVLADGGDALYRAAVAAQPDDDAWAEPFGGLLAVALLAAEVSAFTSHLNSRAAGVRTMAVDQLLDELSAVTVAAHLGVSRQKVYDVARGGLTTDFIDTVPWRQS